MLYTKKEIEKVYSNLVANYIANGARFDFTHNNYCCSEFDCHTDLIANDGVRIIIYTTTGTARSEAFRRYDRGLFKIVVRVIKPVKNKYGDVCYPHSEEENFTAFTFFQYKNIYTDNEETYKIMNETERQRRLSEWEYEKNMYKINYDPSLVLSIIRKRDGFKRSKTENIIKVEKRNGRYEIYVDTRSKKTGRHDIIIIG